MKPVVASIRQSTPLLFATRSRFYKLNRQAIALFAVAASAFTAFTFQIFAAGQADDYIRIWKQLDSMGFLNPIPVYISGFSGEVDSVLKNDLLFMGIKSVPQAEAAFLITGSNSGRLEGRLLTATTKAQILGRAYSNGTLRQQTHAFADEVAKALTQLPGIAQTKIVYKAEAGLGHSEVYIADFDGFGPIAATRDNSIVASPCWAGHGAIAYCSYRQGNPHIFSQELATGARRTISSQPGDNYSPAVSHDGSSPWTSA